MMEIARLTPPLTSGGIRRKFRSFERFVLGGSNSISFGRRAAADKPYLAIRGALHRARTFAFSGNEFWMSHAAHRCSDLNAFHQASPTHRPVSCVPGGKFPAQSA